MATRSDALCELTDVELVLGADATLQSLREAAIDAATGAILSWTGRQIIHNPALGTTSTEYHDGGYRNTNFFTREFPIASVTSLHDDPDRTYGASTLLTEGTHFLVYEEEGRIELIDNAGLSILTARDDRYFYEGQKNIKIVYTAGYTNIAAVPDDLVQACVEWAIFILNTQASRGLTESSISLCRKLFERMGRTGPPMHVRTLLAPHRSPMIAGTGR